MNENTYQEWHCRKCDGDIDSPIITGLLCSACWLIQEEAA